MNRIPELNGLRHHFSPKPIQIHLSRMTRLLLRRDGHRQAHTVPNPKCFPLILIELSFVFRPPTARKWWPPYGIDHANAMRMCCHPRELLTTALQPEVKPGSGYILMSTTCIYRYADRCSISKSTVYKRTSDQSNNNIMWFCVHDQ